MRITRSTRKWNTGCDWLIDIITLKCGQVSLLIGPIVKFRGRLIRVTKKLSAPRQDIVSKTSIALAKYPSIILLHLWYCVFIPSSLTRYDPSYSFRSIRGPCSLYKLWQRPHLLSSVHLLQSLQLQKFKRIIASYDFHFTLSTKLHLASGVSKSSDHNSTKHKYPSNIWWSTAINTISVLISILKAC